ncbi:hypothetical protein SLEP1_g44670 [Rubroshorea leprosula]|uniref:Reverse transcriptase domain-containing protein n=1 Tax=Rubroshorea leprosula TaxID=152421 RepID=A0AAV5LI93_9ROSI|nr:hypothetical protein SLEP1_g44670 [Rubroshorea leprosula]
MGGSLGLLEGGDKDEIKDLVELAQQWLGQWFTEVTGEPFIIKIMVEEATNGIFSMKSDHVFKMLSDSNNDVSESWSQDSEFGNETHESIQEGGGSKGYWNFPDVKMEEDDVEKEEDLEMDTKTRGELAHTCWKIKRQIGKEDQNSALNDISINAECSQEEFADSGDGKNQIQSSDNHERMPADLEIVPESQLNEKKEQQQMGEYVGPYKLPNPLVLDGCWTKKDKRITQQEYNGTVDGGPTPMEDDDLLEKNGVKPKNNKNADDGVSFQKDHEKENGSTCSSHPQMALKKNENLKRAQESCNVERIWAFVKEIGAGDCGNEQEVIRRLKDIEDRDKKLFRKSKVSDDVIEGIDGKRALWTSLKNLITGTGGNWCLMGDFNAIRNEQEWNGGRTRRREMVEFDIFIRDCGLIDLPLIGRKFTRYQPNGIVMSRLDRWQRPHLDGIAFNKISEDENSMLLAPFSEEEVKRAMWSCECSKAPGPNGFNFKFIREMWEEIKDDMMGYVEDFHNHGKLVRGVNSSFIMLIPKVVNPQKIEEFRPISLIGVMYKVIAKLFANRLSLVVDNIIGESQMAFVGGRQMADNIVIANEIIDEAKRKKKASFVFKLDFEKAYDNFANDTILFGKAEEDNIWASKSIMRTFELVSGLKINFGKNQLMGINVSDDWKTKMAHILNCKQGALPCKYLGVPIRGNCRNTTVWKPLVETFKKKLSSWKGRFLSLGGRITLLNSVLSNLPVFPMFVHLLPKGLILSLDKIRRNFLWGGGEGKRKTSWVFWDKVCKSKMEEGLGVKELRRFNLALLGKWWNRLASGNKGLLYRIIKEKYGSVDGHWLEWAQETRHRGSIWWRNICKIDHIDHNKRGWLKEGFKLKMGEGNIARFWKDVWIGDQSLANQFPRLFLVSTAQKIAITCLFTAELLARCGINVCNGGGHQWNGKIFRNFEYEVNRIFEIVQLKAFNWIKGKANGYSFNMYEWMLEPVLSLKAKRKTQIGLFKCKNALLDTNTLLNLF